MTSSFSVFSPCEGAVLDQISLQAISQVPSDILGAYLNGVTPGKGGLILHGFEIAGDWAAGGPPGTKRPDPQSMGLRVSPGQAIITDKEGRKFLLTTTDETRIPWPTRNGPAVQAALVMVVDIVPGEFGSGIKVARETISPRFGFVDVQLKDRDFYLPIAVAIGNGQDWATDFNRIYHPEHQVISLLVKRFEKLERTVWQAEPEGGVWDREVLGKNWFRYQTVGAAALQATRSLLMTYPTTTKDRVSLLKTLREQLQNSVEQASSELLQLIGSRDGAGPYIEVLPQATGE
jgi:hypothetical protein